MIKIGPAGWSYPDWAGRVYPPKTAQRFDPLGYLAEYFDTIEINSTFYRIPDAALATAWVNKVTRNSRFAFTAKVPQLFTHTRQPSSREEDVFKKGIEPLAAAGRLGALLLQFPYAFHQTPENRAYLRQLVQRFQAYPLVLEVRHRSWDRPFIYEFLQEIGMGFCNIDQPQVSYSIGATRCVTSAVGYVRLHGRNASTWFQEEGGRNARYDYLYSEAELNEIVDGVNVIAAQAPVTYLITNNHFRGQAVVNALQLQQKLGQSAVSVPPQLLRVYPELDQLTRSITPPSTTPGETVSQMPLPFGACSPGGSANSLRLDGSQG